METSMNTTAQPLVLCPVCSQTVHGGLPELVDLHALIAREGLDEVAEAVGLSRGALRNMRSCFRKTHVEHLYKLKENYPDFDIVATVLKLGARRIEKLAARAAEETSDGEGEQQQEGEGSSEGTEAEGS